MLPARFTLLPSGWLRRDTPSSGPCGGGRRVERWLGTTMCGLAMLAGLTLPFIGR